MICNCLWPWSLQTFWCSLHALSSSYCNESSQHTGHHQEAVESLQLVSSSMALVRGFHPSSKHKWSVYQSSLTLSLLLAYRWNTGEQRSESAPKPNLGYVLTSTDRSTLEIGFSGPYSWGYVQDFSFHRTSPTLLSQAEQLSIHQWLGCWIWQTRLLLWQSLHHPEDTETQLPHPPCYALVLQLQNHQSL